MPVVLTLANSRFAPDDDSDAARAHEQRARWAEAYQREHDGHVQQGRLEQARQVIEAARAELGVELAPAAARRRTTR